MFSFRKKKKKGKKKPPLLMEFWEDEIKYYSRGGGRKTKSEADKIAGSFIKDGYLTKVVDTRDGWGIYISSRGQMRRLLERERK